MRTKIFNFSEYKRRIYKFPFNNRRFILVFAIVGVVAHILLPWFDYDLVIAILIVPLVLSALFYGPRGEVIFGGALVLLATCPLLLIIGEESIAERIAIWVYILLVIGIIKQISNLRTKSD